MTTTLLIVKRSVLVLALALALLAEYLWLESRGWEAGAQVLLRLAVFATVCALTGLAVGCICGFSVSTVNDMWSRARLLGRAAVVVVWVLPLAAALIAPFILFRDFLSTDHGAYLGYAVLLFCLFLGVLVGRRLSARSANEPT
jgi:hypothetical protein